MERLPERWTVEIGEAILGHNSELAAQNRRQFQEAGLRVVSIVVVVTKMDLAEAVGLDREALRSSIRHAAPQARVFELSSRTGLGLDAWYAYLEPAAVEQR